MSKKIKAWLVVLLLVAIIFSLYYFTYKEGTKTKECLTEIAKTHCQELDLEFEGVCDSYTRPDYKYFCVGVDQEEREMKYVFKFTKEEAKRCDNIFSMFGVDDC